MISFGRLLWSTDLPVGSIDFLWGQPENCIIGWHFDWGSTPPKTQLVQSGALWFVCKKRFYPLVMSTVSYWKWPNRNSGFTHEKWWFSIAMLVYQRFFAAIPTGPWFLASATWPSFNPGPHPPRRCQPTRELNARRYRPPTRHGLSMWKFLGQLWKAKDFKKRDKKSHQKLIFLWKE